MKYTLLRLVQEYQDRTSGFAVDSIFDSDETQQVATIAESVYYDLETKNRETQFTHNLIQCEHVGDLSKPTYLRMPSKLYRVKDSKMSYFVDGSYKQLMYLPPEEFIEHCLDSDFSGAVLTVDYSGVSLPIRTDKTPCFYTTFDGQHLVADSYDSEEEDTLQSHKTRIFGSVSNIFLLEDDFEIPLPEHLHPLYRDMVLKECYESLREELAPSTVQSRVRQGLAKLQQRNQRVGSVGRRVNYGRR